MQNSTQKNICQLNSVVENDTGYSCIGHIVDVSEEGTILVGFSEKDIEPKIARVVLSSQILAKAEVRDLIGCSVMLLFEGGNPLLPVIVGIVDDHLPYRTEKEGKVVSIEKTPQAFIDGTTILLDAKKEIVLRCGKSSIKLTKDGKIVVKGTELVSRSSGANKIKGAAVSIN